MAELAGELWPLNWTRVTVVDVSDDYRLMQPAMPSECYPVLAETWLPTYGLAEHLADRFEVPGYRYDWHECGRDTEIPDTAAWVVGVVQEELARTLSA
jgi:hypothetical protein